MILEQFKLEGKTALVTGAKRGIGKAIAQAYVREGARVFICARNARDVENAVAEIGAGGGEVAGAPCDISALPNVQRLIDLALERFGTIDILVNNASVLGARVAIVDYPPADWQQVIAVNLNGMFFMTKEVLKIMLGHGHGSVINVTSGVGRTGKARWGAYAVSKFGVEGLSQVLAEELKDTRVRINVVNPNATRTEMRAQAYPEEDPATLPTPQDITEVFVYLGSDRSAATSGQSLEARDWIKRAN